MGGWRPSTARFLDAINPCLQEDSNFHMPKRTNDFQELVACVQGALAPAGAKVTSSAERKGAAPGLREIDVLIEAPVGPYLVKIAVEARDHKRKLTKQDIDSYYGKYRARGNPYVDRIVVVSRSGFTKPAQELAALEESIDLFTLEEALRLDWAAQCSPKNSYFFYPRLVAYSIPDLPPDIDETAFKREAMIHCLCHGNPQGKLQKLVPKASRMLVRRKDFEDHLCNACAQYDQRIHISLRCANMHWLAIYEGRQVHIREMDLTYCVDGGVGKTKVTDLTYDNVVSGNREVVKRISTDLGEGQMEVFMKTGPTPDRVIMKFDDAFWRRIAQNIGRHRPMMRENRTSRSENV